MQPIDHLDAVTVFDVGYVEVVLQLDDLKALDLAELGFLVVEEELVWVFEAEECPVAVDLGFGVAWKMRPDVLRVRFQNHLLCC